MKFSYYITVFFLFAFTASASAQSLSFNGLSFDNAHSYRQNALWGWDMAPASFMPEGGNNIYLENVKKPMHAWFLAFAPGAYSLAVTMINKSWESDPANEDTLSKSKYYFAAIPAAMGSLYAERNLEALIITIGEGVGSYFIWSYFNLPRMDRNANLNTFYMGVGIYAFFWVFDMIYAPIMSWQYNKKLGKLYLSSDSKIAVRDDRIVPVHGNALIGPGTNLPMPFVLGTALKF